MGLGSIYLRSAEVQLSGLYEASIKQFQTLLFTVHKSKVLEKMQDSEKKSVQCLSASLMPANSIFKKSIDCNLH